MHDFEGVTDGLDDIRTAIEDLQHSVERLESTVEGVGKKSLMHTVASPFLYGGAIGVLLLLVSWSLIDDVRESKWYIGLTHGVAAEKVSIAEIGYNECAFLTAPIGVKPCYYKKEITTLRWAKNDLSHPTQSFDEGKTWSEFSPPPGESVPATSTVERVNIFWTKVDRQGVKEKDN